MTKPGWLKEILEKASTEVNNRPDYMQKLRSNYNEYITIGDDVPDENTVDIQANEDK